MEKVYDLHQHTHCVTIHIGQEYITTYIFSTTNRHFSFTYFTAVLLDSSINYNKQRTKVTGFGGDFENDDDIMIDGFRDKLYCLFKKGKETWNEEDNFLIKAVSDYLPGALKMTMAKMRLEIENFDLFHYALIVPSEWEEEIRDDIIRPIFVQSGLISNQDHQDRLLFFTDIESIFYKYSFTRGDNTILCRLLPRSEKAIIKFDLVRTTTALFNFPNAKLSPKVMNSNSVAIRTGDVQSRIKDFLRANLFPGTITDDGGLGTSLKYKSVPSDQEQIIDTIIEGINSDRFPSLDNENEEKDPEKKPWIILKKEWMLSESQKEFINSLCPSIICAEIGTVLFDYMKDIISSNFTKHYRFLLLEDHYSDQASTFDGDIKWLKHTLEYSKNSLNSIVKTTVIDPNVKTILPSFILEGAGVGIFEAIQHSDIYCKPRIVPSDLTTSSSVFLNSKPDAIINLDISLGATLCTCLLLDEDGLIQQIFNHDYFIEDKHLSPLGYFYTFSNTKTLNVKEQFIPFAERYLLGDLSNSIVGNGAFIKKDFLLEIKSILSKDLSEGGVLVSIDKKKYIEAFILMYMIYIKEEILCKLPDQLISDQMDMKIGYAVSIEAMLLNNTLESKDNLRDIIYASGLLSKDDHSKKLRIVTQGEKILPAIQKSLKLELSLKTYFVLCQMHEDYLQLSLHQVVTVSSPEEKEQESIIVQDEIIPIQNIYDSLCSSMWYNLLQDSSLIEFCEIHNTKDNTKILDLFSSKIKTEFFANLKSHISDNVLQNNPVTQCTDTVTLTSSCNCKVHLATADIINISFTPVLQDIACTLSASLLNKELFGNYIDIDYLFIFIRFNNNPQLQYTFTKILEEEANGFNLELGIDTSCLVVPELFSQLLQSVIKQQPLFYKDFKMGALQQVCSESYGFLIAKHRNQTTPPVYKSKVTDTKTIKCDHDIVFPILNKGDIINNFRSNRNFYLRNYHKASLLMFILEICRLKTMNYSENNETISLQDNILQSVDKATIQCMGLYRQENPDVPVMISISYVSYSSSLQFSVKLVGADTRNKKLMSLIETGEPLTLTRF